MLTKALALSWHQGSPKLFCSSALIDMVPEVGRRLKDRPPTEQRGEIHWQTFPLLLATPAIHTQKTQGTSSANTEIFAGQWVIFLQSFMISFCACRNFRWCNPPDPRLKTENLSILALVTLLHKNFMQISHLTTARASIELGRGSMSTLHVSDPKDIAGS